MILESHSDLSPMLNEEDHPRSTWFRGSVNWVQAQAVQVGTLVDVGITIGKPFGKPIGKSENHRKTIRNQKKNGDLLTGKLFLIV